MSTVKMIYVISRLTINYNKRKKYFFLYFVRWGGGVPKAFVNYVKIRWFCSKG